MENNQLKGFSKFIALFIISALVISIIIFTASGSGLNPDHSIDENQNTLQSNDNKVDTDDLESSDSNDGSQNSTDDTESGPKFTNLITGLEITEDEYNSRAYGIVIDPNESIYGLSYADIAFEFPIESGTSRMLFFSSDNDIIWKVGALMPTRKYINTISAYIGGMIVSLGEDDSASYSVKNHIDFLDISKHTDCMYTENGKLHYTNEQLIDIALNRTQFANTGLEYTNAPFVINNSIISSGILCANTVVIPYSAKNETTLNYNEAIGEYIYIKNGSTKTDMLNGETISFKNAFVLFSDTTTYESSSASELVVDTEGGGSGYYFHDGRMSEIRWQVKNGQMIFLNLMGDILEVNAGTSYVSFYKSSTYSSVTMK